jgi:hypothetical protein
MKTNCTSPRWNYWGVAFVVSVIANGVCPARAADAGADAATTVAAVSNACPCPQRAAPKGKPGPGTSLPSGNASVPSSDRIVVVGGCCASSCPCAPVPTAVTAVLPPHGTGSPDGGAHLAAANGNLELAAEIKGAKFKISGGAFPWGVWVVFAVCLLALVGLLGWTVVITHAAGKKVRELVPRPVAVAIAVVAACALLAVVWVLASQSREDLKVTSTDGHIVGVGSFKPAVPGPPDHETTPLGTMVPSTTPAPKGEPPREPVKLPPVPDGVVVILLAILIALLVSGIGLAWYVTDREAKRTSAEEAVGKRERLTKIRSYAVRRVFDEAENAARINDSSDLTNVARQLASHIELTGHLSTEEARFVRNEIIAIASKNPSSTAARMVAILEKVAQNVASEQDTPQERR